MNMKARLNDLLERVRAAQGPDRILSRDVSRYFGRVGNVTASIDAVSALIDAVVPNLVIKAMKIGDGSGAWQIVEAWCDDIEIVSEWVPMEPRPGALAMLEVFLSAVDQKEENK